MIEKYFELGVRLRWTKPADVVPALQDGAIVDSTRAAGAMIYDGLDTVISPQLRMMNVSTLGLQMRMPIQHVWLDYTHGKTARLPVGPYDVLTGFMSGCIIARWQERGVTYAGHIGTVTGQDQISRQVKRTFSFAMPRGTTAFDPSSAFSNADLFQISRQFTPERMVVVMALVTTRGVFYAVAMCPMNSALPPSANTEWCVGGIKQVQPIQHDQLKLQLLR